ncbi:hypothetical protein GCM10022247_06560 [Allokutzneria multivorans]|uniref:Uncharacterized protein n=1 Tax=Allokutzneria multivorans TaxID=1142134 RepID=A0ABP7R0P1_9PSEU
MTSEVQSRRTTTRAWWRSVSAWGGVLAVCGGLFHTIVAGLMRSTAWSQIFAEGFFGTLTLDPPPERLALAEAFWFSVGSFGVPLLLLGALVIWVTRRGEVVPSWVGLGVAAWAVLIGLLGSFSTGTLILTTIGVLLAVGGRTARR